MTECECVKPLKIFLYLDVHLNPPLFIVSRYSSTPPLLTLPIPSPTIYSLPSSYKIFKKISHIFLNSSPNPMAPHEFLLPLIFVITLPFANAGDWPPSPGFSPSSRFRSMSFYRGYKNLWGPSHQSVDSNGITIWLDKNSGSGFKSLKPFRSGYFGASIKLQPGYTAGVITAFYLSNNEAHPGYHDEVDIEFLGTTFGKPYTLQTNVYVRGSGDGRIIGREMKFHLWFDPTQDFHHYAILWSPKEIIFFVDDDPVRRYPRKSVATFPLRPMWVYGSIWDASSWATEDGKYKADYNFQPFVGKFTDFKTSGCTAFAPSRCRPVSASPFPSGGLTGQQSSAMQWVQSRYLMYDYCKDNKRDHSLTPECWN